ncbi:MAG: pyrimidine dimer DNA glycosylase/endonuclease V [Candidatus Wallbacteria bacterium]|nr:pyrimidine dimer DNA glycosylase/endonuclease V [Candidatus Wallbacteria bacterium]
MRLWSLHPKYLDVRGLVSLWRESLLAQAVLSGKTRGYTKHPQLQRFNGASSPVESLGAFLFHVHEEGLARGYRFDCTKIFKPSAGTGFISVTTGQIEFEAGHLARKISLRKPGRIELLADAQAVLLNPCFYLVSGPIEPWEKKRQTIPPAANAAR